MLKGVVAPLTEEAAKAVFIIWLLVRRRLGFAVDAAIAGFAVGAGFAVVENLDYLQGHAGRPDLGLDRPRSRNRDSAWHDDVRVRDDREDRGNASPPTDCERLWPAGSPR